MGKPYVPGSHPASSTRHSVGREIELSFHRTERLWSFGSELVLSEFEDEAGQNEGVICTSHRVGVQLTGLTQYWWRHDGIATQVTGRRGSVFAVASGTELGVSWKGRRRVLAAGVEPRMVDAAVGEEVSQSGPKRSLVLGEQDADLARLLLRLARLREGVTQDSKLAIDETVAELAGWIVTRVYRGKSRVESGEIGLSRVTLRRVVDHIRDNLQSGLGLEELSRLANLGPHHFCRMFRRSTGLTPRQYVIRMRVDHAMKLMRRERHLTLSAVASEAGFVDQSHLTNTFRKVTGSTPAAWRDALNR